ncbi:serine/threonine-protein kinase [Actinomadura rudentiformis]|uniref:Serine/threonine protein kinase n=1 Tax=Actinomadura rudentiformis TaxID=359158 RepID=A0A6H9YSI9_9ACTN|nr:serine/threonine-protein kinase [Actinomadura rudentiformis]KAB2351360.1 serine/threonine protein kinase [Actinomadura rudentiformis]
MTEMLQANDPLMLGRYLLSGRLGRGGMGTVYLGEDPEGHRVALKVINTELAGDPVFHERFVREVEAARRVRRFCTAPVLDASLEGDTIFVVTEYIDGPTLDQAVSERGPLRGSNLDGLAVGVATALSAIHDAGLVHRDLKPANVLLSAVGPRVIDFGIARALDAQTGVTTTGQVVGTPAYMAPELLTGGEITPASDVFSWGCVVAFAGTGHSPFEGQLVPEILYKVVHEQPRLDGLDPALREVVEAALAKDPAGRPSVPELLERLAGHPRSSGATQPPTTPPPTTRLTRPDRPGKSGVLAAGIAVASVAAAVVALVVQPWADEEQTGGSRPGGDVFARYAGTWTGSVDHRRGGNVVSTFEAAMTIRRGKPGRIVGNSDYASLNCSGSLTLLDVTESRLRLSENIGQGPCTPTVTITLSYEKDGSLGYSYKTVDNEGTGRLHKVR